MSNFSNNLRLTINVYINYTNNVFNRYTLYNYNIYLIGINIKNNDNINLL